MKYGHNRRSEQLVASAVRTSQQSSDDGVISAGQLLLVISQRSACTHSVRFMSTAQSGPARPAFLPMQACNKGHWYRLRASLVAESTWCLKPELALTNH